MGADTSEAKVLVTLVLKRDGKSEPTKQEQGELYQEKDANAGYKKCVAMPALDDPSAPRTNGLWDMHKWIGTTDDVTVVIHTSQPGALDLGESGKVGLTSDSLYFDTITKKLNVLTTTSLGPLTVDDLRAMGLVP